MDGLALARRAAAAALLAGLALGNPSAVHAHGSPLDDDGCHAAATGRGYHCHQGQFAGQSFASRTEMLSARMDRYSSPPPVNPVLERFSGQVIAVASGDRITVLQNGRQRRVRLHEVLCPRRGQPYAIQSKRFTWLMVANRDVLVTVTGRDPDGALLGSITLPDGRSLTRAIITEGMCRLHRTPSNDKLEQLEALSRAEKRGLWAEPDPLEAAEQAP